MKTNKKHFDLFSKEVKRLLKVYGLISWECNLYHESLSKDSLAETTINMEARLFTITLNEFWADPINNTSLKEVALHEVLEVMFSKVESLVCQSKKAEAREEVHAIIQTLINIK